MRLLRQHHQGSRRPYLDPHVCGKWRSLLRSESRSAGHEGYPAATTRNPVCGTGTRDDYANLKMPVAIVAGNEDRLIDTDAQSARLHRDIAQSRFHCVPGNGHMIHQTATEIVMSAIAEVAEEAATANASRSRPMVGPPPESDREPASGLVPV
jgi:pimeloyl-ACP methyl ester carboxylesterase